MYPSDMTDERWEIVQKHFPAGKRAGISRALRTRRRPLLFISAKCLASTCHCASAISLGYMGDFAIHSGFEDRLLEHL